MIGMITDLVGKVVRAVKAPIIGKKGRKCCKKCRC